MNKKLTVILAGIFITVFSIVTISALASMTGTAAQLRFHLGAAMNTGLTESQMKNFIGVLEAKVGKTEAESAQEVLTTVLNSRKQHFCCI